MAHTGGPTSPISPAAPAFSKVRAARELLLTQAVEWLELYKQNVLAAIAKGDHETAAKSIQYIIDHMPADEDGILMVKESIDKVKQVEGKSGPTIQIGVMLGGVNDTQKQLPAVQVIDVGPVKDE